jgi:hypothetical protein
MPDHIYCFINGQWAGGDVVVIAVAEDGTFLGSHVSSSVPWAQRDIGYSEPVEYRRAAFAEHYPDGYTLEWVDEPTKHAGVLAAFARAEALVAADPRRREPS